MPEGRVGQREGDANDGDIVVDDERVRPGKASALPEGHDQEGYVRKNREDEVCRDETKEIVNGRKRCSYAFAGMFQKMFC